MKFALLAVFAGLAFGQTVPPNAGTSGGGGGGGSPAGSAVTDAQCWASASTFGVCVSEIWATSAAPSTPASGKGALYIDSTSKNISVKDDAGVVKHGVQTITCANQFVSAINDAGLPTCASSGLTLISSQTVTGSPASSITFSSIPSTFSVLTLYVMAASNQATSASGLQLQFNSDTATNYVWDYVLSTSGAITGGTNGGSAVASITIGNIPGTSTPANGSGIISVTIPNYASTTFLKYTNSHNYTSNNSSFTSFRQLMNWGGAWNSTAAINAIKLFPSNGGSTLNVGSTFVLYGQ